jgi:2-methylcitrate dehydratase PrpD
MVEHVGWKYVPQGLTAAQLNLPYCVATLLIEGDVFVDQFSEDKVAAPERMALAGRVEVIEDPAITAKGAAFRHMVEVTVILKDGTHLEQSLEAARGSERSFASAADVIEKFRKLAKRRIPSAKADEIVDLVLNIEHLGEMQRLATLLAQA